MEIIIPGCLVPTSVAPDLAVELKKHCPCFIDVLTQRPADVLPLPPEQTGCTPQEALHLRRLGYEEAALNLGAALAPLAAGIHTGREPVWVAQLCSVVVGREGARMLAPHSLHIAQHEADALFESASMLWSGSEISALALQTNLWRIWPGDGVHTPSMSPDAVSQMSLADWWPQEASFKAWRRLLNEIQMLWHTHPVNEQRAQRGLPPINSLWLYGGAAGWRPTAVSDPLETIDLLSDACLEGDWAGWIAQLPAVDASLKVTLKRAEANGTPPLITLTGQRTAVRLAHHTPSWWQHLVPRRKHNWTDWWNLQN